MGRSKNVYDNTLHGDGRALGIIGDGMVIELL